MSVWILKSSVKGKGNKNPLFPPMKAPSSVLLPWWEEEVEEGEHSPSPQSSPGGERKIKVSGVHRGMKGGFDSFQKSHRPPDAFSAVEMAWWARSMERPRVLRTMVGLWNPMLFSAAT